MSKDNTAAPVEPQKAAFVKADIKYSAAELTRVARAQFNVPPEVVAVALKEAGKDTATLAEARAIVKTFLSREVK